MEGEEAMKAHNVVESLELMYMYDAMKEKKHLKFGWYVSVPRSALLLLIYAGLLCKGRQ